MVRCGAVSRPGQASPVFPPDGCPIYRLHIIIRQYIRTIPEYRGDQFHARATKSHPRIFSFFSRSRLTLPARLQAQINDIIGSTVEKNLSRFCRCVRKNEMMIPREEAGWRVDGWRTKGEHFIFRYVGVKDIC